jgi:hypothetical protein
VVTCTITVSDLFTAGGEAPSGTVKLEASGEGTWDPEAECLLSDASATSATCVVDYAREGDGGELITATYTGDDTFSPAEGDNPLLPKLKDPPPDDDPVLPTFPSNPGNPTGPGATPAKKCKKKGKGKKAKKKFKKCKKKQKKKKKK